MFNKHKRTINEKVNTEGFEFKAAKEGVGKEGLVCWGYITFKSTYGPGVALACNDKTFYRLPQRYVEIFEKATDEELDVVMAGKPVSFREFESPKGKTVIASIDGMDI